MDRNRSQRSAKKGLILSYQRATLLDAPLIFQLIQEGAEAGAFSDAFIERTGSVKLLGFILRSVVLQYFQSANVNEKYEWQVISLPNGEAVGFLKLTKGVGTCRDRNLELLAVCPAYRNKGIGSAVLEHIVSGVPNGAQLIVHCTKYARTMQHILKRRNLKRNVKFGVPRLEEYRSNWSGISAS